MRYLFGIAMFLVVLFPSTLLAADTNSTVSSTVVTDKAPPTANAPSVVINNSDVCKSALSAGVQTQILGIASGIAVTDENCERMKLSRSLYLMGMKVAAVSTLCQDARVFDAMWMAGTPCPYMGAIGDDARAGWEKNTDEVPEDSEVFKKKERVKKEQEWQKELEEREGRKGESRAGVHRGSRGVDDNDQIKVVGIIVGIIGLAFGIPLFI